MSTTFDVASQNNLGVLNGTSQYPSISADGNFISLESFDPATMLEQDFVKNELTSVLTLISQSSTSVTGNAGSFDPVISANGANIAFQSGSTNLVAGVAGGISEIYSKTIATNGLQLVSQTQAGVTANGASGDAAISQDGNVIAFDSTATNLNAVATAGTRQIYVKNLATGVLTLASQTSTGTIGNSGAFTDGISLDGNLVVFESSATDLGSANGSNQIYVKNLTTGALTVASESSASAVGNAGSFNGNISSDGLTAVFDSTATNLVPGVTSGSSEIYEKNLVTGAISLVSQRADGTIANGTSSHAVASADGKYVMFESTATNLDPAATTGTQQVYVKNLQTGAISLLSKDSNGVAGNASSFTPFGNAESFSADGSTTTFATDATNLAGTAAGVEVVLRAKSTAPVVTLNGSIAGDNVVDAAEDAANVTFSGTSDQIGQTVAVFADRTDTTNGTQIGSATVQANGTWTFAASLSALSQGAHSVTATVQSASSYLSSTSAAQTLTIDTSITGTGTGTTTGPTVAFNPDITFNRAGKATLTGTVSDPSSQVTQVEIFNGTTDLGPATLKGDTWTLKNVTLPSGVQSLAAQATDAAGHVSAITPSANSLETGIRGQPYTRYEQDFDASGSLIAEFFTKQNGTVYLSDFVSNLINGDHDIFYAEGTYFADKDYYASDTLYGSQYAMKVETTFNNDGTTSITGFENGQTLNSYANDVMTGGGRHETFKFEPGFGQDLITDFQATGAGHDIISLSSQKFSTLAQVLAHTTNDVDGNAVIHVGQNTITVQNVSKETLSAHKNDFTFHA